MFLALISGLLLGFVGSIAAGPTSVVIAESALTNRPRRGLAIAVGAACAEALYAFVAFSGFTAVLANYPLLRPVSRALAGVVLCLVGVYLIRRRVKAQPVLDVPATQRDVQQVLFGFTLAALNPTLLVTWGLAITALDAALGSASASFNVWHAFPFALGAALGIVGWSWTLLRVLCRFRKVFAPTTLNRALRGTGVVLVAMGLCMTLPVILRAHVL